MLFRFDDAETERAYTHAERAARIPATRMLAIIGIVTLLSFIAFNPMYFSREAVLEYNTAAGLFIALLLASLALTYTPFYVQHGWIDLVIFTALAVPTILLVEALAGQSSVTGISRFGVAVIHLGILVVFASIVFVATTRYYLAWSGLLLLAYLVFLSQADRSIVSKVYTFTHFTTFFAFGVFVNWDIDRRARNAYAANLSLKAERAKTEALLYNVLPEDVVGRLGNGETVADAYSDVSVIFVDIVGFSRLARTVSPGHLVKMLSEIFSLADMCARRHGIEKVKTIGDSYLAVSGGTASREVGAEAAVAFGRDLIEEIRAFPERLGIDMQVRVGIHTGPVVGGVIGSQRLAYDYWGDTVNIASRIEGVAKPNGIALSEATFYAARANAACAEAELVNLKGVGEIKVYHLAEEGGRSPRDR